MHQVMSGIVGFVAVLCLTFGLMIWTSWSKGRKTKAKPE
jgi:hypothetical protein